ncbi:hypothetical protein BO70DRAFT_378373 [Aspergillus heteromorphus CBS 117.55]|uniref:AA1-like domain-containing protein n=1 Tax=Aspergillus heteromorphus CBS 117.55 TaxID=1448321 RepID=A0A317WRA5_9EURO|nr:uncharacterized protein BO70DRAFT_378373 [Aspergillus heteromorphus CBS 117.55]PWY86690.1 hypothetical protein BO70DRAFT_378373 [Aspergillus heteromorphus CBS 117.55]
MQFPSSLIAAAALALAAGPQLVSALWECDSGLSALGVEPADGTFYIHYTSVRDSNYKPNGDEGSVEPWIRVCNSNDGAWESTMFAVVCTNFVGGSSPQSFDATSIGLEESITVYNGEGCDSDASNLESGYIKYGTTEKSLETGCGTRDHGVTCEFTD